MQSRPKVSSPSLQLYVLSTPVASVDLGNAPLFRLGLVVPKRHVRKAVARNLIKRWVRELSVPAFVQLSQRLPNAQIDLLVRVRGSMPTDWKSRPESRRLCVESFERLAASV